MSTPIDTAPQNESKRCCVPKIRYVVTFLGMMGCMVDYLVRFGLSVAIVSMVDNEKDANVSLTMDSCPMAFTNSANTTKMYKQSEDTYSWSAGEQGIILGTFFWGYFLTKSTGGRITEIFGAREVMAVSLCVSGMLCIVCPSAADLHPMALAACRFLMGIFQGPAFPALYCVLAKWAPPDELATMVTIGYSGMSVGSLIALGGSGWVVDNLGWRCVFYIGGILALVWTPFWLGFVSNDPQTHFLISKKEQELLIVNDNIRPRRFVPWKQIFTCWRFYPSIMGEVASSWLANITSTEGPTFLVSKVGLNMEQVSYVLAAMQTCAWFAAFTFGRISDLLGKYCLSKVNTRKCIHSFGSLLITFSLVGIVMSGCDSWTVSILMVMLTVGSSCSLSTFTLTPMDIAPNYAGTMSGLLGIGNISGFIAPIVTNALREQSGSWVSSILLTAGIYFSTGLIYVLTTTASIQDWNDYEIIPGSNNRV